MQLHAIKSIENFIHTRNTKRDHFIHPVLKECAFYKTPSVFIDAKELNNKIAQYMNPRCEIDEAEFEKVNPYQVRFPLPLLKMHPFGKIVPSSQAKKNFELKQLIYLIRRVLHIKNHTAPVQKQIKAIENPETPSQTMPQNP